MERRYKIYKGVNDVAGYHCKAWKCVTNNKGLQKPQILKKNTYYFPNALCKSVTYN